MTIQTIHGADMRRKLSLNFGGMNRDTTPARRPAESHLTPVQLRHHVALMVD